MNKKSKQNIAKVFKAYSEGQKIERFNSLTQEWEQYEDDKFDFSKFEYRAKPKMKYRPYKDFEEFKKDFNERFGVVKDDNFPLIILSGKDEVGTRYLVTAFDEFDEDHAFFMIDMWYSFKEMFEEFEYFPSGEPFGILTESEDAEEEE